ncbi:ThiF family adenylyltransferase [Mycoplasma todarodis]|uniref:ThiF family adenylyltransferase n=1 Tax=Mycoplasma todarodis TaxID=1937191 RepID=UPI003B33D504
MKITLEAKELISLLKGNGTKHRINNKNNQIYFNLSYQGKEKEVVYSWKEEMFYIHKNNNTEMAPHILGIENWLMPNNPNYMGLCLTRDKTFRETSFDIFQKIKRVEQIIFEIWPDRIQERFNEIETLYQARPLFNHFMESESGIVRSIELTKMQRFRKKTYIFKGETKQEFLSNLLLNYKDQKFIIEMKYQKLTKRFIWFKNEIFWIDDYSREVIFNRVTQKLDSNKYLIIGMGSVGSVVMDNLIRNGAMSFEVFDHDLMSFSNNPRHIIGRTIYQERNKALAAKEYYEIRYPFVKVKAHDIPFMYMDKITEKDTIIINTTGGSDTSRRQRFDLIKANNKNIKFIDIFIEPFGVAMHAIVQNVGDSTQESLKINWKERAISRRDKDFRETFQGCFTSTLPYGMAPIQVGVPLLLKEIESNNYVDGHYTVPMILFSGIEEQDLNPFIKLEWPKEMIGVHKWK